MKRVQRKCKCGCGKTFYPRVAEVKRGWGQFFSRSCKAKYQEKQTELNQRKHGMFVGS